MRDKLDVKKRNEPDLVLVVVNLEMIIGAGDMTSFKKRDPEYQRIRIERQTERKKKRKRKALCKCGYNQRTDWHTCPYSIDMYSDYSSTCRCCYDCEQSCAGDI